MSSLQSRQMLNKVPEVTIYFWIVKILCTTVGETAADYLNGALNFGLTGTSVVMSVVLSVVMVFQFRAKKYIPSVYWFTVVLISIVGTLITDNLTDKLGVPLPPVRLDFIRRLTQDVGAWRSRRGTRGWHDARRPVWLPADP